MRLHKFISWIIIFSFAIAGWAAAAEIPVAITMIEMRVEKASEQSQDELYMEITQYPSVGQANDRRLPVYPMHWVSKQISNLKNLILWEGKIAEGETIHLVLSLLEQEFAPWDPDDLIGAAELTLRNEKGVLKTQWGIPVFEKPKEVELAKSVSSRAMNSQDYVFKGDGSRYDISFRVEQN